MWDRGLCGGPGIIGGSQIGVTASMTIVVVPIVLIATCNRAIDDSSAAIATDTSAVVDTTPMDLAISAVGVDPLVIADACIWSVSFFVGPSVGYVGERTAYAHHLYRPRGVQLNCHLISDDVVLVIGVRMLMRTEWSRPSPPWPNTGQRGVVPLLNRPNVLVVLSVRA